MKTTVRFDIQTSKLVPWLTVISGVIAIGGVLVQIFGNQSFLAFLKTTIPIPFWVIVVVVTFAPAATLFVIRR